MPELPIWHVAIRGTPVGPLRRSEVLARLRAGEIDGASLAWREGLADWQAVSAIAELKAAAASIPPLPPVAPMAIVAAPASIPPARAAIDEDDDGPSIETGGDGDDEAEDDDPILTAAPSEAAARSVAMAELAARAIALSQSPEAPAAAATARRSDPSVRPLELSQSDHAIPALRTQQRSPLVWAGIACAAAFGGVFAWFAAQHAFAPPQPAPAVAVTGTMAAASPPANSGHSAIADNAFEDVGDDDFANQLAGIDAGPSVAAVVPTTPRATTGRTTGSAESEALPMPVSVGGSMTTGTFEPSVGTVRPNQPTTPLDSAQISSVIRRNQARAQRCYEVAATMNGHAPDMRLSVAIRISPSGSVTAVDVSGQDFGGTIACVRRTIMAWQFPASTTGGSTIIPLVFVGGS